MDEGLLRDGFVRRHSAPVDSFWLLLWDVSTCTVLFWLVAIAAWLFSRRLAGELQTALGWPVLLAASLAAGLLTLAVVKSQRQLARRLRPRLAFWLTTILGPFALLMLAGILTLPGTSAVGLATLWAVTGGVIAAATLHAPVSTSATAPFPAVPPNSRGAEPREIAGATVGHFAPANELPAARRQPDPTDEEDLPLGAAQQLTRGRNEQGQEYLHGRVRVDLPANHRSVHLHVAICPPFSEPPVVEVEQISGPDVTTNIAMVLPQGIRFDIKRGDAVENHEAVLLEFYAHAPSADGGSLDTHA